MPSKVYNFTKNVYDAAVERMEFIFSNFETIVVSCSGGKDSTVLTHMALDMARKKNRQFYLFYLDQEIEYQHTIDLIDWFMKQDFVIPLWFQVPCMLTNTSSVSQHMIDPWNPDKKDVWVHGQKVRSIKKIDWDVDVPYSYPNEKLYGFGRLVKCMEQLFKRHKSVAQILGIRADESLDRYRAVTKNPGLPGVPWCTKGKYNIRFYPIYDWHFSDVWAYLGKNKLKYNRLYDLFYLKGMDNTKMRLSNLLHEKAYEAIALLQEFEPQTVDRMLERVAGIATAQEYAGRGGAIYKAVKLPKDFKTWTEFRDYLLDTLPNQAHAAIFRERFSRQFQNDYVVKQQVNRILITDVRNRKKINNLEFDPREKTRQKWMEAL